MTLSKFKHAKSRTIRASIRANDTFYEDTSRYVLNNSASILGSGPGRSAPPASQVLGWGSNTGGEATGIPSSSYATGFVKVSSRILTNVVAIAAGRSHALALRSDGAVAG